MCSVDAGSERYWDAVIGSPIDTTSGKDSIGREGPIFWLPRRPDLTPMEFFVEIRQGHCVWWRFGISSTYGMILYFPDFHFVLLLISVYLNFLTVIHFYSCFSASPTLLLGDHNRVLWYNSDLCPLLFRCFLTCNSQRDLSAMSWWWGTYCNVFGFLKTPFWLVIGFINNPQL
jgi:hypothetical protein